MADEPAEKAKKELLASEKPEKAFFANNNKIGHEELYTLITGDEISWQAIIYDLVRSEQLDPLDINIALLTQSFLEKIRELEEHNFFVSGKVLLAASILLRMKAERIYDQLLLFDELLFGKEEHAPLDQERYFISPEELPLILPKTPLPRKKRVTIEELLSALNKAIEVEVRRHKKYDSIAAAEREVAMILPAMERIKITEKIREVYKLIREYISKQLSKQLTFTELVGSDRKEDKIVTFIPLLHLDHREKITLEQPKAFEEIYITLYKKPETE